MKTCTSKVLFIVLLVVALLLVGCDTIGLGPNTSGSLGIDKIEDLDLTKLKEKYGEFSITATKGDEGVW